MIPGKPFLIAIPNSAQLPFPTSWSHIGFWLQEGEQHDSGFSDSI